MGSPLQLQFVTSAANIGQLPNEDVPEVAVVGRSNAGKSSLINALSNRKGLAKVSKTPGRTQLINYFTLQEKAAVVDLPGYGFANAPARVRATWQPMIEGYLLGRSQLRMILVLVDGEIGPTKLDVQMIEWLAAFGRPYQVIATKHDKVKSSAMTRRKKDLAEKCGLEKSDIVWVSASKNVGIDRLRGLIHQWLEIN
ncbi:MAG TPA: ribosome biogenesis GTP-binding protein YihA/YsxC [Microthrixaceae bacterium]|nr:ribosome biogenesis GTP-binding protein YihA/YsxC [Microthrixaceae bacterium]